MSKDGTVFGVEFRFVEDMRTLMYQVRGFHWIKSFGFEVHILRALNSYPGAQIHLFKALLRKAAQVLLCRFGGLYRSTCPYNH